VFTAAAADSRRCGPKSYGGGDGGNATNKSVAVA